MYKEITTILTDYISVVWNDGEREEIPIPKHIFLLIYTYLDKYEQERNKEQTNG